MPPHVPRKTLRETRAADVNNQASKSAKPLSRDRRAAKHEGPEPSSTPQSSRRATSALESLLEDNADDASSLTSLSDEDFEDVPGAKAETAGSSDEDDEEIEFEDVEAPPVSGIDAPEPTGDLELTLNRDTRVSLTASMGDKRGLTKREKKVRSAAHRLHVLMLLWHNAIRNSWLCHPEVQATMLSHLPPRLWDEVDRWRQTSGLVKEPVAKPAPKVSHKKKIKGQAKSQRNDERSNRDWTSAADRLEQGAVDMSHGDPIFRLMQSLVAWWKQRFRITAPGLRKRGYMSLEHLDRLTKAQAIDDSDADLFGEKIDSLDAFCRCARKCQGSRDVGSQLFVALLRALGIDARLVANLQTLGFGWTKLEEAEPELERSEEDHLQDTKPPRTLDKPAKPANLAARGKTQPKAQKTRSTRSREDADVIVLDDSDQLELEYKNSDDDSVVELECSPRRPRGPAKKFDMDLEFPHYWAEVLSPVTHKYLPVDPIVKGIVATSRELTESLEPRGGKADKARQIMAYIVGHSRDGTAKDITVRYLKRQIVPGKTKGVRFPIEKVPVYNRHGKIKRHEQSDWFKKAMSGYTRGTTLHPLTEIDKVENDTDLTPVKPEKKLVKEGEETLQYYKSSKEFALQRHLKREEALKPSAEPVKVFKNKVKGGKVEDEDVFLRTDVLNVKSAETWHKQGRAPLPGEQPLKRVPYRAATTNRRREILEAEAATGQKVLQGLFSYDQTDWIIPPPIENGIIPKNGYGNIDLFAEHMCPEGAVHIPYRGVMKVCKRLGIDYAEAVVGFEFGHRMAVPVIKGAVIAEEHHDQVMEELEKDEAERKRKEDEKRRKAALGRWRKFMMGLRIVERIRQDYGHIDDSVSVFRHGALTAQPKDDPDPTRNEDEMGGGFLPEGQQEEEAPRELATSNFFPIVDEDDDADDDGDLIMEDDRKEPPETTKEDTSSEAEDAEPAQHQTRRRAPTRKTAVKRERPVESSSTQSRKQRKVIDESEGE